MPDRELSLEELAEKDGQEGRPVYIAYEGRIYDVSLSKLWKTGTHMKRHSCAKDLTTDISAAPHGPEVLERFEQVGVVKREEKAEATIFEPLFKRFPMLRRHPHPMTVHFPIVFMLASGLFTILYFLTGNASFDTTAFHCLGAGVCLTPFVMATGFISWWVNYLGRPLRPVSIKMVFSLLLFCTSVIVFVWRMLSPDIVTTFRGVSVIYLLLILSLSPMVSIVGWYGAKLTFPIDRE